MTKHDDGGLASRSSLMKNDEHTATDEKKKGVHCPGDLWDYYAGQAIGDPILERPRNIWQWFKRLAGVDYCTGYKDSGFVARQAANIADAMIQEKHKREA